MRLEEYLDAIENCPDSEENVMNGRNVKLIQEFGTYDNYIISLKSDAETIETLLTRSPDFEESKDHHFRNRVVFNFIPGTVILRYREDEEDIIFHTYQGQGNSGKKMERVTNQRALALAISKLLRLLRDERIAFGLPNSQGWAHLDDDSRIVRYNPEEEEK